MTSAPASQPIQPSPGYGQDAVTAPPTIDTHGGKLAPTDMGGLGFLGATVAGVLLFSPVAALVYGLGQTDRPPSPFRTIVRALPLTIIALAALATVLFESLGRDAHTILLWVLLGTCCFLGAVGDALLATNRAGVGLAAQIAGRVSLGLLFALAPGTRAIGLPEIAGAGLVVLATAGVIVWLWPRMASLRGLLPALLVLSGLTACLALTHQTGNNAWTFAGLALLVSDALLAATLVREARLFGSRRLTTALGWLAYYAAHLAALLGMIGYVDRY